MSFSIFDFSESLERVEIKREDVKRVLAAYGEDGTCSEWSGGFWLQMNDGRMCIIEGWCDTTGWGCQDGAEVKWFTGRVSIDLKRNWEHDPADLNLWLQTGINNTVF